MPVNLAALPKESTMAKFFVCGRKTPECLRREMVCAPMFAMVVLTTKSPASRATLGAATCTVRSAVVIFLTARESTVVSESTREAKARSRLYIVQERVRPREVCGCGRVFISWEVPSFSSIHVSFMDRMGFRRKDWKPPMGMRTLARRLVGGSFCRQGLLVPLLGLSRAILTRTFDARSQSHNGINVDCNHHVRRSSRRRAQN